MHPRAGCVSCMRETRCCHAGPRPEAGGLSSGQTSINLSRKARTFLCIQLEFPPKMEGGKNQSQYLTFVWGSEREACCSPWVCRSLWGAGCCCGPMPGDAQGVRCHYAAEVGTPASRREDNFDLNVSFVWSRIWFLQSVSHVFYDLLS